MLDQNKMSSLQFTSCLVMALMLITPSQASIRPDGCTLNTFRDGLHRATCSSLDELYKFTLKQKHHNINILDLSHNNITKLSHELDRLTEIVTLDLSTNGITSLNKFLRNAKKLVHLNLANNRLKQLSVTNIPVSVSSLDLKNNLLRNVPSDLEYLSSLEHMELEGNPLDCTCSNILARDHLISSSVYIDVVKCATPIHLQGTSWLELKTKVICQKDSNIYDMMMGDQPIDAVKIGEETTALKSMSLLSANELDDSGVIHESKMNSDDDSSQFLRHITSSSPGPDIEGSGEIESSTISDPILESRFKDSEWSDKFLKSDEILPADNFTNYEEPEDGSGEGSGFSTFFESTEHDRTIETTPVYKELKPTPLHKYFEDDNMTTEYPTQRPLTVFQGGSNWLSETDLPSTTEKSSTTLVSSIRDTTISERIQVTSPSKPLEEASSQITPHKTGTYVCIAIIVVLLVSLIGFAIIKAQMRKRRDRRLLRQQRIDVEQASKEMVDMNKSLLGKPAPLDGPMDKKVNGKYELVPTHDALPKKNENGDVANGIRHNGVRNESPRDTNQNKSSSVDNNLVEGSKETQRDTSFDSNPDSKKDTHSLSSEDVFVPLNDEDNPRLNGNLDSDMSQPIMNGEHSRDSDFLAPREYIPVYSPDMGRVRIKMTETPKPKTPVLVTRSRSNAGDIIITPSVDIGSRKSNT